MENNQNISSNLEIPNENVDLKTFLRTAKDHFIMYNLDLESWVFLGYL